MYMCTRNYEKGFLMVMYIYQTSQLTRSHRATHDFRPTHTISRPTSVFTRSTPTTLQGSGGKKEAIDAPRLHGFSHALKA